MRSKILLFLFCIFLANALPAQEQRQVVQVQKSTDKVKIGDKFYYIHIVKKGESLYSISKTYNVSQIDIASDNPDIILGIKVDQAIKIPAKDVEAKSEDQYIHHIVKKGETLFGLSKRYNIPIEDIVKVNPDVESGLVLSQILLIPKEKLSPAVQKVQKDSLTFIYHEVKQKEGLYSISKLYNVSIQEIESYNKDVLAKGLRYGTTLKIPRQVVVSLAAHQEQPKDSGNQPEKPLQEEKISKPKFNCDTLKLASQANPCNIALLLPLIEDVEEDSTVMVDPVTGEKYQDKPKDADRITSKTSNFLDFYEGFLLAVDSLKRRGLSINLSVFNTKNQVSEVKALQGEKAIQDANLIIGPVYPELLSPMADFAREKRINIVSPLSPDRTILNLNPYLFQVNPSYISQIKEFVSKISFNSDQNHIIIFEDSVTLPVVDEYKKLIAKRIEESSNSESIHLKEMAYKPGGSPKEAKELINQSLVEQKENVIYIPSENEAFVSDFLSHLYALTTYYGYKVKVYGFPKWQRFRNIPIDYFYKLNVNLFTPYYVDYEHVNVKKFIYDYRRYYRSEPTQYSFQGYDVGLYFLVAMKLYGVDFKYCLENQEVPLLQSKYNFVQDSELDGFENNSIFMIHYSNEYEIVNDTK